MERIRPPAWSTGRHQARHSIHTSPGATDVTAYSITTPDAISAIAALIVFCLVGIAVAAWVGRNEVQP